MFRQIKVISLLILVFLFFDKHFAQTEKRCFGPKREKCYGCYTSLFEANKVPVDSVKGLILISNNFTDFPNEVLKFRNLKYLEIGSHMWFEVLDSLTPKQRREHDSLKAKLPDILEVNKLYKPNSIRHIPKEIANLKQLEFVDLSGVIIKNKKKFRKIYEYLPRAVILPYKEFLDDY